MSDELIRRLRDTPNWRKESFGHWKDCTSTYDRAPFEAADRIAELEAKVRELEAERVKEKERADFAWRNANAIDQSRMKTEERVKELEAERESLIDSGIDKIMAASDEQINALCRQEGHDPNDEAKLAKYACEMVILKHKLTASRAQVERLVEALKSTGLQWPNIVEALAAVEKERGNAPSSAAPAGGPVD